MRPRLGWFLASLVPVVAFGGCGGSLRDDGGADAGSDAFPGSALPDASPDDAGCPDGAYPIGCDDQFFYCCPPDASCSPPSCPPPDAGAVDAGQDANACPPDQFLIVPCCGGDNDTSCSNSAGPPAPPAFCATIPLASCHVEANETVCTLGGCEGILESGTRTLGCTCL